MVKINDKLHSEDLFQCVLPQSGKWNCRTKLQGSSYLTTDGFVRQ